MFFANCIFLQKFCEKTECLVLFLYTSFFMENIENRSITGKANALPQESNVNKQIKVNNKILLAPETQSSNISNKKLDERGSQCNIDFSGFEWEEDNKVINSNSEDQSKGQTQFIKSNHKRSEALSSAAWDQEINSPQDEVKEPVKVKNLYEKINDVQTLKQNASELVTAIMEVGQYVLANPNALSKKQMQHVRETLLTWCNAPRLELNDGTYAISEYDSTKEEAERSDRYEAGVTFAISAENQYCMDITLATDHVLMILDAKMSGSEGFKKGKQLGEGAMNAVYLATTPSGQKVAIKSDDVHNRRLQYYKICNNGASVPEYRADRKTAYDYDKAINCQFQHIGTRTGTYRRNLATEGVQEIMMKYYGAPQVIAPVVAALTNEKDPDGYPEVVLAMPVLDNGDYETTREYIKNETWLQIEDCFTGQLDRHHGNVMFDEKGNPQGIDHDFCFPTYMGRPKLANIVPDKISSNYSLKTTADPTESPVSINRMIFKFESAVDEVGLPRNFCLPPVIDTNMRNAILNLDLKTLESKYRESGLTRAEIYPAMERAKEIQKFVREMPKNQIIQPDQWSEEKIRDLGCDEFNCYALRHAFEYENLHRPF